MTSHKAMSQSCEPVLAGNAATQQATRGRSTRLDQLADMLRRPGGASLDEICAATGWQAHSVRGAISGALKKKGHTIVSERIDGVRRYRIGDQP